jgi:uncharacterized protein YecE (DUF72 family)
MIPYIGTSGYSYKSWKGSFYPEDLPNKEMLRYYGERFRSVEINNTFYRMPSEKVLTDWHDQVPDGFAFVLKASRRITHFKRLKDAGEELSYVLRTSSVLQKKLGPTLLQLPPNFKKDLPRLQDFLKQLPQGWRAAVEFRHASWFEDDVYETLRDHNVAMVIAETDEETVPIVSTTGWGYLRLRRESYDQQQLAEWVERIGGQEWSELYAFFKHEEKGTGPETAAQFVKLLDR